MTHNPTNSFNLYHGTTLNNLSNIIQTKEFIFKPRKNHWLGNGVYFFENDVDKAIWWSGMATRLAHKGIEERAIIFIEGYKIKREKLLDLDSETDRNTLANFIRGNNISLSMKLESKDEEQRKIEARAIILNFIVNYYKKSAVKYTFHKDNITAHSFLDNLELENNETQFCIMDTATIDFNNVYDITQEVI